MNIHLRLFCQIARQTTPTAADIQYPHAGSEAEFLKNVLTLLLLRLFQ